MTNCSRLEPKKDFLQRGILHSCSLPLFLLISPEVRSNPSQSHLLVPSLLDLEPSRGLPALFHWALHQRRSCVRASACTYVAWPFLHVRLVAITCAQVVGTHARHLLFREESLSGSHPLHVSCCATPVCLTTHRAWSRPASSPHAVTCSLSLFPS